MRFKFLLLLLCVPLQGAVYDCFIFYNELELLDIRFHELDDVVDHFVLVESSTTFRGQPKPYIYEENKERFAKFADKIIHVKIEGHGKDAWIRENLQRDAILQGLTQCDKKDIILISDVDEIIPAQIVCYYSRILKRSAHKSFCFQTLQYEMFLNRVSPDREFPNQYRYFIGPVMVSYDTCSKLTPIGVRGQRCQGAYTCVQAGWHFTNMGGFDKVVEKTNNYSFWNMVPAWEDRKPYSAEDQARYWSRVAACHLVPIDHTYPKYIVDNIDYFKEIGFIDSR